MDFFYFLGALFVQTFWKLWKGNFGIEFASLGFVLEILENNLGIIMEILAICFIGNVLWKTVKMENFKIKSKN